MKIVELEKETGKLINEFEIIRTSKDSQYSKLYSTDLYWILKNGELLNHGRFENLVNEIFNSNNSFTYTKFVLSDISDLTRDELSKLCFIIQNQNIENDCVKKIINSIYAVDNSTESNNNVELIFGIIKEINKFKNKQQKDIEIFNKIAAHIFNYFSIENPQSKKSESLNLFINKIFDLLFENKNISLDESRLYNFLYLNCLKFLDFYRLTRVNTSAEEKIKKYFNEENIKLIKNDIENLLK